MNLFLTRLDYNVIHAFKVIGKYNATIVENIT